MVLDASQHLHEEKYAHTDRRSRRAQSEIALLAQAPRYILEAIGAVSLVAIALLLSRRGADLASTVPVLGALALGGQRLLPLMQQGWIGYNQAASYSHWLRDVAGFIALPVCTRDQTINVALPLLHELRADDLCFAYDAARPVVRDLSFSILPGERVGIAGSTGTGKSTVLDLLMGLLTPGQGLITVDGQPLTTKVRSAWQASIAHVPQAIYLVDDTIAANIALGVAPDRTDKECLVQVARATQLHDFIEALPLAWRTPVGERGVRLSGGQRQRIGLARALYKRAKVLVLDEATNALDESTEAAVLDNIFKSELVTTIIMVAHRNAALARCDRVIRLQARCCHHRGSGPS